MVVQIIKYIKITRILRAASFALIVGFTILLGFILSPVIFTTSSVSADTPANDTPSISLTTINDTASLPISAMNGNGTFATTEEADSASFNITTTNLAGYTLLISSDNDSGKLILGTNADAPYFSSIDTITATSTYSSSTSTNYNNTWGIKPSKYVEGGNSISSVVDNTGSDPVFLPSPTTSPITLDITNTTNTTPNNYTLGLGARADFTTTPGSYKTTIDLILVANPAGLIITYNKNTEDSIPVSNMPSPQAETGDSNTSTTITLSNNIPQRAHYTFAGWCDEATNIASCPTGATLTNPGEDYTVTTSTGTTTKKTLYAVWTPNYYMQDVSTWGDNLSINESVQAIDRRDNKIYWVTKLETDPENPRALIDEKTGKSYQIWMTQNLDYDLVAGTTLTHADTDLGWGTGNSSATWTVQNSTFTNIADWQNNSDGTGKCLDEECSYTNGDKYIYTSNTTANDTVYDSLSACKAAGYTADECAHYLNGNYYNFRTSVALGANDNIGVTGENGYDVMPNSVCPAGWRLPTGAGAANMPNIEYSDYGYLLYQNGITLARGQWNANVGYTDDGFNKIRVSPIWITRAGHVFNANYNATNGSYAGYWNNTVSNKLNARNLRIRRTDATVDNVNYKVYGFSIRCIARADSMQDAVSWSSDMNINESKQVADVRDNKVYWVTKLETDPANPRAQIDTKTGKSYQIWMTQNLDLNFSGNQTYNHYNTDLGYTSNNTSATWTPSATMTDVSNWQNNSDGTGICQSADCSLEVGSTYYYTSGTTAADKTYNSITDCINAEDNKINCSHSSAGNYYSYRTANAIGATDTVTSLIDFYSVASNSVCPAGWQMPVGNTSLADTSDTPPADNSNWGDYGYLLKQNNVTPSNPLPSGSISVYGNNTRSVGYSNGGFNKFRSYPLYFVRSGNTWNTQFNSIGSDAQYWSGSLSTDMLGNATLIYPSRDNYTARGFSVRCILR